jgi:predicted nucleotidyltransferase component of viral defense system
LETNRFAPDIADKVARLARLLADIWIHPFLGTCLALKGGTALNLFYLDAPRLSVDADLNYVGASGPDELAAERSRVIAAATAIAEGQGYRVAVTTDAHALSALTLSYRSTQGVRDTLKLEVNYMYRAPLGPTGEREARITFGTPLRFKVVSFAELVGGKLVALLDRTAARDLYDAAALADTVEAEDRFVRRVFVAMAGMLPRHLNEYGVERIHRVTSRDIETSLYPVLASTDRPTRDEMLRKVEPWIAQWLALDPEEQQFHELLNSGVVRGSLLFPSDPDIASAIDRHPGLLWRALNAARKPRLNLGGQKSKTWWPPGPAAKHTEATDPPALRPWSDYPRRAAPGRGRGSRRRARRHAVCPAVRQGHPPRSPAPGSVGAGSCARRETAP